MKKYFFNYTFLSIAGIVAILLPLYLYKLNSIPTNITGDETVYLWGIYKILFGKQFINPFVFLEDTKPALNFYWMSLFVALFQIKNSVFAMRTSIVVMNLAMIVLFFLIVRKYTNSLTALLASILMGTNVWFINFTRTSWFNLGSNCAGLGMILLLEKAFEQKKKKFFIIAGILGGLCFYTYFGAYVYPIAAVLYLIFKRNLRRKIQSLLFFSLAVIFTALPILLFNLPNGTQFMSRPKTVFITHQTNLATQTHAVVLGLFLFNGLSIGSGVENPRYAPVKTPILEPLSALLFFTGIFFMIRKKKTSLVLFFVYLLSLIIGGILTIDPPSLSRTTQVIPFIYFSIGTGLFELMQIVTYKKIIIFCVVLLCCFISMQTISAYFSWVTTPYVAAVRQPAIEFSEYPKWQKHEINLVKQGLEPINNYQWYSIRGSIQ